MPAEHSQHILFVVFAADGQNHAAAIKRKHEALKILIAPAPALAAQPDVLYAVLRENAAPKDIVAIQHKAFFCQALFHAPLGMKLPHGGFHKPFGIGGVPAVFPLLVIGAGNSHLCYQPL